MATHLIAQLCSHWSIPVSAGSNLLGDSCKCSGAQNFAPSNVKKEKFVRQAAKLCISQFKLHTFRFANKLVK